MNARAIIDLAVLRANVRTLTALIAPAHTMFAVKADAYGHGLIPIAKAGLESGATSLAVLEIPAGLRLRAAGVQAPLFAWLHGPDTDFRAGVDADIELGVSSVWQLDAIAAAHAGKPAVVHLKLDSGLSRNGATPADWPALVTAALTAQQEGTIRLRAAWSHLADTSVDEDTAALRVFLDGVATARGLGARFDVLHLAASSAGIRMPEARFDLVRFGIAAYGISPFDDRTAAQLGVTPVMSLEADVVEVLKHGHGAVARLGLGYADGVPEPAVGDAFVLLGHARARVRSIDVDSMLVDADAADRPVQVGDTAVVFGTGERGEATAADWAGWAATIGDEIVTHVSARVPRVYRG